MIGFAGLWSEWSVEGGKSLSTCCVLTTPANEAVRPFHDRMSAVRTPADYETWLDDAAPLKQLHALLKPYPAELMAQSKASALVNSPKNEGPQLLDPAA